MSTKLTRVLALLLAFVLFAAACGSDDPVETATTEAPADDDASAADDAPADDDMSADDGMSAEDDMAAADDAPADSGGSEPVEITMLGTLKSEIAGQFEEAVVAYNSSQDAYELVIIPLPGGGATLETATAMYSSGNAPTMMSMQQEIPQFADRLLDLSGSDAVNAALGGTLDQATQADGRIVGVPQTIEAYGILYNKAVVDAAVGGTFDPATINTRSALVELMGQIDALDSTEAAIQVSPMDWSLGAHLLTPVYSTQSEDAAGRRAFIDSLKDGSADFAGNAQFNGWMDTLDAMLEFNQLKDSPLDSDFDPAVAALSSGEVGLWFMGNWAVPPLSEAAPDGEFGIMPLPISDDASDFGNTQIPVGVPAYMVVDAEQSTPEQQAGAIDFLNWLTTSAEGKVFYTDEFAFLPGYADMNSPTDNINSQIVDYATAGSTLEWMNNIYPADGWPTFGATLQKYISGNTDRDGVASELAEYWTTVE